MIGVSGESVDLPPDLAVAVTKTGGVYHLPDGDVPMCYEASALARALSVEQAAEEGYTPCEVCFRPPDEREIPDRVLVAIGGNATVFHADREGVEYGHEPVCNYGPVDHAEQVFTDVAVGRAERAGLSPCSGCFGAAGEALTKLCPLCLEVVDQLSGHLPDCSERESIGRWEVSAGR